MPTAAPNLSETEREFLAGPHIATIATAAPDGTPHQTAIWYRLEPDDRILVNSRPGRRWPRELEASGRCSLAIIDEVDRYHWLTVDAVLDDVDRDLARAREDIVALSVHYGEFDEADAAAFRTQDRVTYRLRIAAIHAELDD